MTIGICTRYHRHEATYLAVQVASWAARHDTPVSLASCEPYPIRIGSPWDTEVESRFLFTNWLKGKKVVVWTHVPHLSQLQWALEKDVRAVIMPLWHELADDCREQLHRADAVIATTDSFHHYLTRAIGLKNVRMVQWHTGQIQCVKRARNPSDDVRIAVPLFDGAVRKVESTLLEMIRRTLDYCPSSRFEIWYNPCAAAGHAKRALAKLASDFGDRCLVSKSPQYAARAALLAGCDLTLLPTEAENTGMTALISILAGTPVVAFDVPPLADVVTPVSGMLVPTGVGYSQQHIPVATPDYRLLEVELWRLLERPPRLAVMQQSVAGVFAAREQAFNRQMLEGVFG